MAKKLDSTQLLDFVRRSKLVAEDQLDEAVRELKSRHDGKLPDEPVGLAKALIERDLITRWHAENLLRGKYKGYFLGKYKLLDFLGSGGMSSVYLAEHTMMHRKQAIKVLPKKRLGDASFLDRFKREALATATLDHPHIVRAYDIDNEGDVHYLVMEYVPGQDLQALVKSRGWLEYRDAVEYIAQSAQGLQHAHDAGLIHRDVKPANLLLNQAGQIKILDLGLALFSHDLQASLTLEHNENVLGTADYLAPEQALSSHDVDSRADIYGLGCTFYYLLTGHAPFPEGSMAQRLTKHQTKMPPDIRQDRPDCPTDLVDICFKMMQKDPKHRCQTMQEVAETLRTWLACNAPVTEAGQVADQGDTSDEAGGASEDIVEALGALSSTSGARSRRAGGLFRASTTESTPVVLPQIQVARDESSGVETVTGKTPRTVTGNGRPMAVKPTPAGPESDDNVLELGIEVFGGESSSLGARAMLQERRARAQQRDRTLRLIWCTAAALFLLIVLLLGAVRVFVTASADGADPAGLSAASHSQKQS